MNSERIRQAFGNFGIHVIECSDERRVANLYSTENGVMVCRTYAEVVFNRPVAAELAAEHALVLAGQSIGAVFKRHSWTITKRHLHIGTVTLTGDDASILSPMGLVPPQRIALHSYVFEAGKDGVLYDYATIAERHHPQYLTATDLKVIYGEPAQPRPVRASERQTG